MRRTQPIRDRRTKLSLFVRDLRSERRLTQEQLQQLLGMAQPQYVSKVEIGAIRRPRRQFMEALAKVSETPVETLLEMCEHLVTEPVPGSGTRTGDQAEAGRFTLAFAHCLWGAPIFLAAHRGMLKEFRVASLMETGGPSTEETSRLRWISPKAAEIGPVPGPLNPSSGLVPLSAADVIRLLEEQKIDVAVAPGSVLRDSTRFLRVGSIADSPAGCYLILDEEHLTRAGGPSVDKDRITTHELAALLRAYDSESNAGKHANHCVPVVGVEDSSLAKEFLIRACESVDPPYRRHMWLCPNRDLAVRNFQELKEACKQGSSGQELIGTITWDPYATWLANMHGKPVPRKMPIYLSPNASGQPTHISFDVIVNRTTSLSRELRDALLNLMGTLWRNARTIGQAESSEDYLRALAVYFGFESEENCSTECPERTAHAINCILYSVRLDMESFL